MTQVTAAARPLLTARLLFFSCFRALLLCPWVCVYVRSRSQCCCVIACVALQDDHAYLELCWTFLWNATDEAPENSQRAFNDSACMSFTRRTLMVRVGVSVCICLCLCLCLSVCRSVDGCGCGPVALMAACVPLTCDICVSQSEWATPSILTRLLGFLANASEVKALHPQFFAERLVAHVARHLEQTVGVALLMRARERERDRERERERQRERKRETSGGRVWGAAPCENVP